MRQHGGSRRARGAPVPCRRPTIPGQSCSIPAEWPAAWITFRALYPMPDRFSGYGSRCTTVPERHLVRKRPFTAESCPHTPGHRRSHHGTHACRAGPLCIAGGDPHARSNLPEPATPIPHLQGRANARPRRADPCQARSRRGSQLAGSAGVGTLPKSAIHSRGSGGQSVAASLCSVSVLINGGGSAAAGLINGSGCAAASIWGDRLGDASRGNHGGRTAGP